MKKRIKIKANQDSLLLHRYRLHHHYLLERANITLNYLVAACIHINLFLWICLMFALNILELSLS